MFLKDASPFVGFKTLDPPRMSVHEVYEAFGIIRSGQDADVRVIEFNLTRDNIPHELVVDCAQSDDEIVETLDSGPDLATTPAQTGLKGTPRVHNSLVCSQLTFIVDS